MFVKVNVSYNFTGEIQKIQRKNPNEFRTSQRIWLTCWLTSPHKKQLSSVSTTVFNLVYKTIMMYRPASLLTLFALLVSSTEGLLVVACRIGFIKRRRIEGPIDSISTSSSNGQILNCYGLATTRFHNVVASLCGCWCRCCSCCCCGIWMDRSSFSSMFAVD